MYVCTPPQPDWQRGRGTMVWDEGEVSYIYLLALTLVEFYSHVVAD